MQVVRQFSPSLKIHLCVRNLTISTETFVCGDWMHWLGGMKAIATVLS